MREILFRGKCMKSGEWIYGDYLVALNDGIPWIFPVNEVEEIKVDPSTVGQYTGRTDKNGKRVFEGDIIRLYTGVVGVVLWHDNDQAYLIFQNPVKRVIYDDFGNYGRPEYYEVIGNIHDNPELLEGGSCNE